MAGAEAEPADRGAGTSPGGGRAEQRGTKAALPGSQAPAQEVSQEALGCTMAGGLAASKVSN